MSALPLGHCCSTGSRSVDFRREATDRLVSGIVSRKGLEKTPLIGDPLM